jgi:hypothetical protein
MTTEVSQRYPMFTKKVASMLAAAMLATSVEGNKPKPRKHNKKSTGYAKALQAKFTAANAAYETRKEAGATLAGIEREYELKPASLKGWRSRRLLSGDGQVRRACHRTSLNP